METEQWRKAAEQGDAKAQYWLDSCYDFGFSVAQDKSEAVKCIARRRTRGMVWPKTH